MARGFSAANTSPKRNINNSPVRILTLHSRALLLLTVVLLAPVGGRASQLKLPPEATEGLKLMYTGKTDQAFVLFRKLEAEHPEHPLGYLLEADVLWWKIYCASLDRKYNTVDAWIRVRGPEDDAYLALADKVARLAEAAISKSDTAEMELYAGLGYALRARLLGLRYEKMSAARAGVETRKHLLRCLELDPAMADAYTGLGLYNYYVDTLSAIAKVLRFFMGIPGGDKRVGLRQLETAAGKGELTRVEARFYMSKNLRNYDRDYARAAEVAAPLTSEFPENSLFLLLAGDVAAKLGHNDEAASRLRAAAAASMEDAACSGRVQRLVREALAALGGGQRN
jgi:hypothetical protein